MPKPLTVLTNPDQRLRRRSEEVNEETLARFRREGLLDALVETMRAADGVGIAAPQVGVPYRIIVVLDGKVPRVCVNPVIISRSIRTEVDVEGCLSVPGIIGTVQRAKSVTMRARDVTFHPIDRRCRDLVARIVQHEVDHLDGVLFIDRAIRTAELPKDADASLRV